MSRKKGASSFSGFRLKKKKSVEKMSRLFFASLDRKAFAISPSSSAFGEKEKHDRGRARATQGLLAFIRLETRKWGGRGRGNPPHEGCRTGRECGLSYYSGNEKQKGSHRANAACF